MHSVWGWVLCLSNKLSLISIGFVSSLKTYQMITVLRKKQCKKNILLSLFEIAVDLGIFYTKEQRERDLIKH